MDWGKGKRAIARAIHLDLTHTQDRYAAALQQHVQPGARWLDVGCGHSIVPDWAMPPEEQERLVRRVAMLVGIDLDEGIVRHPLLTHRVKAICGQLPFKDGSFDLVTANMVVEHVTDPDSFLSDVSRVLRPGGRFLFVTPNYLYPPLLAARLVPDAPKKRIVSFLEHRKEEDIFPTHYRMNSPRAIEDHATKTGFQVEQLKLIGSTGSLNRLGPVSWIECLLLKGLETSFHGKLQPDILAVLARQEAA
jgi:ubiquinone/menaquinone biosynthesis C-methylase UbiE